MTTTNNGLKDFLSKTIYHWVGKNFGSQEADEPSWNIEELSSYLAKELGKRGVDDLKPHELTVLLRDDIEDTDGEIDTIKKLIRDSGGTVVKVEDEGKKRLAYKINGKEFARYIYFDVLLPKEAPVKISSQLNINNKVLRYLLVMADTRR